MDLTQLLKESRTAIIAESLQGLARATLPHYKASHAEQNSERLTKLFDLTLQCVDTRTLIPIAEYARGVHTAFNVLEEVIWRTIAAKLEPLQYPEAFGLASTVLGAGKQALALEWVSLAGHHHAVRTLDLSAMFR
jgi:hypothetical protein